MHDLHVLPARSGAKKSLRLQQVERDIEMQCRETSIEPMNMKHTKLVESDFAIFSQSIWSQGKMVLSKLKYGRMIHNNVLGDEHITM